MELSVTQVVPFNNPEETRDITRDDEISRLAWHPAFVEAIKLELEAYGDSLEFFPEYQLTSEPLRIDCVVIKKAKEVVIKKNIAAIFRDVNLLEYKSPDDYVSIEDYYKVYAYACLYASFKKVPITSLTITFIESHVPRELLEHLSSVRNNKVEEKQSGIYTIVGDVLPIQIIDNRQLSAAENLWLKGLSNRLGPLEYLQMHREIALQGKEARIQAYLNVIAMANFRAIKEAIEMSDAVKSLDDVFEKTGMAARWEAKAEARTALDIAQNMVNSGFPLETVVSMTKLDPEKVKELYKGTGLK